MKEPKIVRLGELFRILEDSDYSNERKLEEILFFNHEGIITTEEGVDLVLWYNIKKEA